MQRRYRWPLIAIISLAGVLILFRLALPDLVRDYLNERMASMGDYSGAVADVDIHLWRGAYSLEDLNIVKSQGDVPVPFFSVERLELAVSWRALLRGAIVADARFLAPTLNFVDDEAEQNKQSGAGTDWRGALQQLVPIEINYLRIDDGQIHFRNFNSEPPVDLHVNALQANVTNLSNADRQEGERVARVEAEGRLLDNANAEFYAVFDPLLDFQDFELRLAVRNIELVHLNDLTEAYGNFDFESGRGDFVMELEATQGQLQGYAKPILDHVEILKQEDLEEGILSAAWEAVVAGLGWLFRNHPEDRIASQIEISGDLNQNNVSAWQAFVSILRNAFVDAYDATFQRE